jgi:amino acid adenylation domain-containing protein
MGATEGTTLHELIAAQTRAAPSKIAVTGPDGDLTYGELERRAEQVAARLAELGARPDRPVGLLVPRSAAMIAGMLGILRAGGAYLPLDPEYPETRVGALLSAAGAVAVVTTPELAARVVDRPVVVLGEDHGEAGPPRPSTPASALCYVLFTSGSTGAPKAVAVEHRQYVHYLDGLAERIEPGWSWALLSTFSADLGSTNVFAALTTGGRLHVLSREQAVDADALAGYFARHRIDAMKLVPSHLAALAGVDGTAVAGVLPRRLLICAGEPLQPNLVRRVRAARPELAVENHYGPTETTVSMLAYPVPPGLPETATVPLGRPFRGVRVHVLGPDHEPVPDGVTGTLGITGGNLARGYLGAPAATAAAFTPCPAEPGERMYETGDLVRRLPTGDLEFVGRGDDQVKIMGYRVEPGEVAAVLARHPDVGQAVVVPHGTGGERRLAGYVTGSGVTSADVRAFAADRLPEHMVPSTVVVLDALPLNPNGKIDRAALPDPFAAARSGHRIAPGTGLAEQVTAAWAATLGHENVGPHDNFFDIGGTSLLLMRLRARLVQSLEREISMVTLFRNPTVHLLVRHLEAADAPAAEADSARGRSRLTAAARDRRRAAMSGGER